LGTVFIILFLKGYLDYGNYVEEYALPFISCSIWIFLDYYFNKKSSCLKLIACGFCFMGVMLLRQNMITTWIVLGLFAIVYEIHNHPSKLIVYLLWFSLGAAILLLPVLIYLYLNGALVDFWKQYFLFNFSYSGKTVVSRAQAIWQFFWTIPGVFPFLILGITFLTSEDNHIISIIFIINCTISLIMIGLSGRTYMHYGIVLIPLSIVPMGMMLKFLEDNSKSRNSLVLCCILALLVVIYPWVNKVFGLNTNSPIAQSTEGVISAFIKQNTTPDETIMSLGNQDIFYVLSERKSASKYSYQMPIAMIDKSIYDTVSKDIRAAMPAVILIHEPAPGSDFKMDVLQHIVDSFVEEHNYEYKRKVNNYTIYLRESLN